MAGLASVAFFIKARTAFSHAAEVLQIFRLTLTPTFTRLAGWALRVRRTKALLALRMAFRTSGRCQLQWLLLERVVPARVTGTSRRELAVRSFVVCRTLAELKCPWTETGSSKVAVSMGFTKFDWVLEFSDWERAVEKGEALHEEEDDVEGEFVHSESSLLNFSY